MIVCAKETIASNTSTNFLLTVFGDRRNRSDICLWHCLVSHAHRNIPKASIESHCPWLATKVVCNKWKAGG
uniref:Uncharacterized protein n=1 Tax=Arundo donax TaxID=35708 RepID=A0A0A9DYI1_ARUDO